MSHRIPRGLLHCCGKILIQGSCPVLHRMGRGGQIKWTEDFGQREATVGELILMLLGIYENDARREVGDD